MNAAALQAYIRQHIPVAGFMQVTVLTVQPDLLEITAPLEPNLNVHGTLFGGSATALALVAAWSLVHVRMQQQALAAPVVVQGQTTRYFRPVTGAFRVRAMFSEDQPWAAFAQRLAGGDRARVGVVAEVRTAAELAARLEATFAGLPAPPAPPA